MRTFFYFILLAVFTVSCDSEPVEEEVKAEQDANYHKVSFEVDGDLQRIDAQQILNGGFAKKPNDPNKDNFEFKGWFINDVEYSFSTPVLQDLTLVAAFEANAIEETSHLKPEAFVQDLGKGFDVTWSEFTKYMDLYSEQAVIDFAEAGFKNVRIRMGEENPDDAFMTRLKMQVDHCLAHGIYPILSYQGKFIEEEAQSDAEAQEHLVNWWRTMAEYFKDYPDDLTFNILVEISGTYKTDATAINNFYLEVLKAIRETNPYRIVIFPPVNISNPDFLSELVIPGEDDLYTMAEWHFYAAGPNTREGSKKYWKDGSTAEERNNVMEPIQTALNWMAQTGYKTWIGAWMAGNYNKGNDFNLAQQVHFASFMTRQLEEAHLPWSINAGNKFYDYENQKWFNVTSDAAGIPVRDVLLDPNSIALYKDTYYNGSTTRFNPGVYDANALKSAGVYKNLGSLMIPFDYEVILYSGDSLNGNSKLLTQTQDAFDDFEVGSMEVRYLDSY